MKQLILNLSQISGKFTNDLSIRQYQKGNIKLCKFISTINDYQLKLDLYLRLKFNTKKSLKLKVTKV
jgi:hypothetical protein